MSYKRLRLWGGGAVRVRVFALFASIFLAISAFPAFSAEPFNPADYVNPEYGHKDTATDVKYYKFDTSSENIVLVDGSAENHDFAYYVDSSRCSLSDMTITVGSSDKDFIDISKNNKGNSAVLNFQSSSGNVIGDFVGNSTTIEGTNAFVHGGAVNASTVDSIKGNFINNSAISQSFYAIGGAISIRNAKEIAGNFIGNYAVGGNYGGFGGGAIFVFTNGSIESIKGNFISNYTNENGGAIFNDINSNITNVTGLFAGNFVNSDNQTSRGGAICNNGTMGITNSNFIDNHVVARSLALGGAIYTKSDMMFLADGKNIEFTGNHTIDSRGTIPNAIFVATTSDFSPTITLNAANNGTITFNDQIDGGTTSGSTVNRDYAYNLALTGDTTGTISLYNDIINANVTSSDVTIDLANKETKNYEFNSLTANQNSKLNLDLNLSTGESDKITTKNPSSGSLIINSLNISGSSLADEITFQILDTPSDNLLLKLGDNINFVRNVQEITQNTLYNDEIFAIYDSIKLATTNTTSDSLTIKKSGIYDTLNIINTKESDQQRNFTFRTTDKYIVSQNLGNTSAGTFNINGLSSQNPSIIDANGHTMFNITQKTVLNISNTTIQNAQNYAINAQNADSELNLVNTSILNTAGDAIISNVDLNITANDGISEFSGNNSAMQINNPAKSINLNAQNNGKIILNDPVNGSNGYNLNISTDATSSVVINNNINNANLTANNANLSLTKESALNNALSISLNNSNIDMTNDLTGTMHAKSLNLAGTTSFTLDVDLENGTMDTISADSYTIAPDSLIDITKLNLISTTEKQYTKILFADSILANIVKYSGENPTSYNGTSIVYSPIYKYIVNYGIDEVDKMGYFTFSRPSSGVDAFNPAVLASPVAQLTGAYITQLQTFNYAFQHSDIFMNLPKSKRFALKTRNKYALNSNESGVFSPLFAVQKNEGFWVKPYASFESVPLANGPKVSNINYGTIIGHDSDLTPAKFGFDYVLTSYIAYNGASQRYQGVDSFQNGGIIGQTITLYKNNFFNATTINVGASSGDSRTIYGSENYTMLLAGIANKTGINIEFKNGKFIIQPAMMVSYSFINTFDYNNAAGINIKSDPLNAIQLAPGIKFIANTKSGWQPYLAFNMVWNILDKTRVTANTTRLPSMSIDPYVQYGIGVQKQPSENLTAFAQAMIHNGGRNGVSLSFGFRWAIGKKKPQS